MRSHLDRTRQSRCSPPVAAAKSRKCSGSIRPTTLVANPPRAERSDANGRVLRRVRRERHGFANLLLLQTVRRQAPPTTQSTATAETAITVNMAQSVRRNASMAFVAIENTEPTSTRAPNTNHAQSRQDVSRIISAQRLLPLTRRWRAERAVVGCCGELSGDFVSSCFSCGADGAIPATSQMVQSTRTESTRSRMPHQTVPQRGPNP